MDPIVALGWIISAGGLGTLLGAAIGFYASESARERRLHNVNQNINKL